MRIPNAERAVIVENKVRNYLLNVDHEDGGTKAMLLISMGYVAEEWAGWLPTFASSI